MDLKSRIEKTMSEILSDKYQLRVNLRFAKGEKEEKSCAKSVEKIHVIQDALTQKNLE